VSQTRPITITTPITQTRLTCALRPARPLSPLMAQQLKLQASQQPVLPQGMLLPQPITTPRPLSRMRLRWVGWSRSGGRWRTSCISHSLSSCIAAAHAEGSSSSKLDRSLLKTLPLSLRKGEPVGTVSSLRKKNKGLSHCTPRMCRVVQTYTQDKLMLLLQL
jgi:hypothetical protein